MVKALDGKALVNLYNIGGKDLVLRMIDGFLANTPERLSAAKISLDALDARKIHLIFHSLKASAANLGTDRLRSLCEAMELMALEGRLQGIPDLFPALEDAYREAAAKLERERDAWRIDSVQA